jgi:uncharacterized membrane protein
MPEEPIPAPPLPEPSAAPSSSGLPVNIAAMLACLLPLAGGIVFLVIEKTSAFVRFYAMQSLFFGIASVAVSFALEFVAGLFHRVPVLGTIMFIFILILKFAFGVGWLVLWLITTLRAFSGVEWEIPLIGPLARKQLGQVKTGGGI